MITPENFLELTLDEKIKVLYTEGLFVTSIRYYGYKINLYLLDQFYVEVFYNHKLDKIEKIDLMDPHHSRIKFYTDQIQLPANLFT